MTNSGQTAIDKTSPKLELLWLKCNNFVAISFTMDEEQIWNEIGGEGFERITKFFYEGVRRDSLLGPMYPADDWEGAESRLALFLKFRFGADQTYLEERGHPRLRARHMPFAIGEAERDRWLDLMETAIKKEGVAADTRVTLMTFFAGIADFMRNR